MMDRQRGLDTGLYLPVSESGILGLDRGKIGARNKDNSFCPVLSGRLLFEVCVYKEAQRRTTFSHKTITPNPSSRLATIANDLLLWEVVGGGLSFYALRLLGNSFSFLSQGFIDQFCCLWNTG